MKKAATIVTIFFLSGEAMAAPKPQLSEEYIPSTLTFEAPANEFQKWSKPLPCPSGIFSTVITVFNPAEHAQFQSGALMHLFGKDSDPGITFSFATKKHLLPLRIQVAEVGRTQKDVRSTHQLRDLFAPGDSITVEVSWVNSRSFSFNINGHEQYTITLAQPVTELYLMGVGSRSVFDKNIIQCNLVA
jgi:hypothetical protein